MPEGCTVNNKIYVKIICHLRDAVRMKCPEK
jgi:hypothetical protein